MPHRPPWLPYAATPLTVSLITVVFCAAASAQGLYSRSPGFSQSHFAGVPGYGSRPTWSPAQQGPFLSGDGAGSRFGASSGWPSRQQGPAAVGGNFAAPGYGNRQPWPYG